MKSEDFAELLTDYYGFQDGVSVPYVSSRNGPVNGVGAGVGGAIGRAGAGVGGTAVASARGVTMATGTTKPGDISKTTNNKQCTQVLMRIDDHIYKSYHLNI